MSRQSSMCRLIPFATAAFCLLHMVSHAQAQPPPSLPAAPILQDDGYVTQPELQPIVKAYQARQFEEARRLADALIRKLANTSKSTRLERFVKANALYLRGLISEGEEKYDAASEDFAQASDLGHSSAPYRAGARFLIRASKSENPEVRSRLKERSFRYFLMGAELADAGCMEVLQGIYKELDKKEDQNYWFLLERMSEPPDKMQVFKRIYEHQFTGQDRSFLSEVLRKQSLSGGATVPISADIPGRSQLTVAFSDWLMRLRLSFVWRAFYDETRQTNVTVREAFQTYKKSLPRNPFATVLLLAVKKTPSDGSDVVATGDRARLASLVLPGDELIVRSGDRTHQAMVWKVDPRSQQIFVLDPFPEFWQPTHNKDIKVFQRKPYRHQRELVVLSWPEVKQILIAVIAIRDQRKPPPRAETL